MLAEKEKIEKIHQYLAILKTFVCLNTKVNLTDICIVSEDFFCGLLNIVYGYELMNANILKSNCKGIDLHDGINKVVFQITRDKDSDKIQTTIDKFVQEYDDSYQLKFVIINDKKTFTTNFSIDSKYKFDKSSDIMFIDDFSKDIKGTEKINNVYGFFIESFYIENFNRKYKWYENNNKNNIADLGCRYNKEIDINTPTFNLLTTFLCDQETLAIILHKIKKVFFKSKRWENKLISEKNLNNLEESYSKFIEKSVVIELSQIYNSLNNIKQDTEKNIDYITNSIEGDSNEKNTKRNELYEIQKEYDDCLQSVDLILKKVLIITGDMGTGKSHILASYIENERINNQREAIFILGQHLNDDKQFKLQIKEILELNEDFEIFIELLNAIGKEKNIFIPIIIDALNESRCHENWSNEINGIIKIVSKYSYVKLVLSLRNDYTNICLPNDLDKKIIKQINHRGFGTNVYDAMAKIFEFYSVPVPLFPIINSRYTNPLFLVSMCKWIRDYKIDLLLQDYNSFEKIFEAFIDNINLKLAKEFGYKPSNRLLSELLNLIVVFMIENSKIYVSKAEFCLVLKETVSNYGISPIKLLDTLISEGLIFQSIYAKEEILYFSYEQYASILKSKMLVNKMINGDKIDYNEAKKVFNDFKYDYDVLKNIFIILGNKHSIEIYDILKHEETKEYGTTEAYMDSLMWRSVDSFDKSEKFEKFLDYTCENNGYAINNYNQLFYCCCTIETSPFNIYKYNTKLLKMSLVERDSMFTINLDLESVDNIIQYSLKADMTSLGEKTRVMLGITLSWFLVSPNRYIRDNATKALVNILTDNIGSMLALIDNFKDCTDLYILERVYGACYGALLRSNNISDLDKLMISAFENVFNQEEVLPHIIIRYYAKNIILYGIHNNIKTKINLKKLSPPYNSKWYEKIPSNNEIKQYEIDYKTLDKKDYYMLSQNSIIHSMLTEDAKDLGMYGDFGRYYFGYEVGAWKNNFDSEQDLSNIVIDKVFKMGYDPKLFGEYDRWQTERNGDRHSHTRERIGKKYQWMATYELIARLQDNFPCFENVYSDEIFDNHTEYYNWHKKRVFSLENARYKKGYYEECNAHLLNIDVTNLIVIPKKKETIFNDTLNKNWFNEDLDIPATIEKGEYISLDSYLQYNSKNLELLENKGLYGDYAYNSMMTICVQAYLYSGELNLNENEKEGMFRGLNNDSEHLLMEYPWKDNHNREFNSERNNCLITSHSYSFHSEYDKTNNNEVNIKRPSVYLINYLELKQDKKGYWYNKDGALICYDTILQTGESELLINKKFLIDLLKKENLKIMWMGYVEKKHLKKMREYRFRLDKMSDNSYKLEKYAEESWEVRV